MFFIFDRVGWCVCSASQRWTDCDILPDLGKFSEAVRLYPFLGLTVFSQVGPRALMVLL